MCGAEEILVHGEEILMCGAEEILVQWGRDISVVRKRN